MYEALRTSKGSYFGVRIPEHDRDTYHISYSTLVVPLVKAVQEFSTLMEDADKRLANQKTNAQLLASASLNSNTGFETQVVLHQNVPNPFTSDTEIGMLVPDAARSVEVVIYNLHGEELNRLTVTSRGE